MHIPELSEVGKVLYEWRKHSHIYWELTVATYGKAEFYTDLGDFQLKEGELIIIPPDVEHNFSSVDGYKDRSIYIDKMDLDTTKLHKINGEGRNFIDLSKRLMNAYKNEENGISSSFEGKAKFFLRYVINILNDEQNLSLPARVRNYINVNFSNSDLSEEYLAKRFEYNGNYLRRTFKANYGLTPMQYLAFVRLSQAKNLLQFAKNYSINEISYQCGFSDQLYFSRFFKKHTGTSPTLYRSLFTPK